MAPEKSPNDDYHIRLYALYQTLDNILHPMPKRPLKKLPEDKFVVEPGFALQIGKSQGENKPPCMPKGCIYFEKLNKEEHKAVSEVLTQYAQQHDNFALLPPRICNDGKKCPGHHFLEDIVENALPADLSYCFVYFFA
ncbi:MAG: hypothetical protein V1734_03800 [Nanoarchaeota archaeon]